MISFWVLASFFRTQLQGHFAAFCQGPPNRRTRDRSECLLPVVLNFLREVRACGRTCFVLRVGVLSDALRKRA